MSRLIVDMLELKIITFADLEGFSDHLIKCAKEALEIHKSIHV